MQLKVFTDFPTLANHLLEQIKAERRGSPILPPDAELHLMLGGYFIHGNISGHTENAYNKLLADLGESPILKGRKITLVIRTDSAWFLRAADFVIDEEYRDTPGFSRFVLIASPRMN